MAGHFGHSHSLRDGYRNAGVNFQDLSGMIFSSSSSHSHVSTLGADSNLGLFGRIAQFVRNIAYGAADPDVRQNSFYLPICSLKSRIPWLPRRSKSRKVCYDELCKMVVDVVNKNKGHLPVEETIKLCDLLSNLQDMVPYYLHSRYHSIDCLSLYNRTKSTGNYWTNAVQFSISNAMLGVKLLQSFDDQLKENHQYLEHESIFISNMVKNQYIQTLENVEDCKSAEEFLLEPWVLLQLPFEPVILHQWAVALMVEALRFQKKITDFTTMTYPENLKTSVDKLTAIALLLLNGANTFLSFVAKLISVRHDTTNQMHLAAVVYWDDFQQTLPQVLSALKFVLREECNCVIALLKRTAWSKNQEVRTCKSKIDFQIIASVYSHTYWESHQVHEWLFLGHEWEPEAPTEPLVQNFRNQAPKMELTRNIEVLLLTFVIDNKILKPGRLRGESKEVILKIATANFNALKVFHTQYDHYFGLIDYVVVPADKGVIYDILKLYAEVKIDEAVGLLTQSICDLVKKEVPTSRIFIDLGYPNAPKLKLNEIDSKLDKAFLSSDWTYKKLIRRTRASCFSPQRTPMPDRDEMTIEEIAEHFQERIRNMVFKMIEKQYTSLVIGPPFHYHPEIIVVQYVLPCFVASYLEMEKTNESNQAKEEYLRFVDELVKNYEQHNFCLELADGNLKQEYFKQNYEFQLCFYSDIERNYKNAREVIGNIAPFCSKNVVQKGLAHIFAFVELPKGSCACIKSDLDKKSDDSWFYQKHMIFNRIHACLDKLGKIPLAPVYYSAALGVVLSNLIENTLFPRNPKLQILVSVLCYTMQVKTMDHLSADLIPPPPIQIVHIYQGFSELTDKQLFNLIYFIWYQELFVEEKLVFQSSVFETFERQCFPLDLYGKLFWCILDQEWWKLKIIASEGNISKEGEDLSLIPLSLAKKSRCCKDLIKAIGPSGKIQIKKPGAITFYPIKYCRWCGLVKSKTFRLCSECKENRDYPDRNYFCSEICETECLKNQHTEEHVQYLLMQLDI